jgi:hypothetical protein
MVAPMVENLLSKYEALSLDPNNGRGSKRAGGEHLPRKLKALSSTPYLQGEKEEKEKVFSLYRN